MLYLDMQKTKTKMKCALLHMTHLPLLLVLILASANLTASRSSCPSHCGNISIPYPFGIGKGCYLNEWFAIQCNNSTSGDLVPYLPKVNNEVVKISLPDSTGFFKTTESYGSLRIKTNITSMGCSNGSDETKFGESLNFTGTPFTIGRSNIFKAIGCNYKAILTHLEPTVVGCISTCEPRKVGDHTRCRGNKCCQVDPPSEIGQVVGINMEEILSNITREKGCRVAFLTDETQDPLAYREAKVTDPKWFYDRQYVILQLRWAIPMTSLSFINSMGCTMGYSSSSVSPCICTNNTNDQISSLGCACHKGYTGNPYILGGCKDIDECQLDKGNYENCRPQGGTCVNTQGSYQCVFKKYKTMPVTMGLCVGFGVLMMVFAVAFLLCKFIKKQRKVIGKRKLFRRNGGLLLKQQLTSAEGSIEKTRVFTSKELKKATENFSSTRVLGKGGQGTVYKGMLVDGRIVAVKKSTVVDQDKVGEFINEVVILSQINHRNIVKLIGCCLETEVPLLVYEFVSNGNLFEHLHGEFDESALTTWEMRLSIIIDIAQALSYLHSSASSPIFHRDVKSTNIMLDEKYRVKVSDFGTSRWVTDDHTHLTTVVSGTVGYVDPEYFQTSQFTDKSDVYSFGVVLVELITGEKPISFVRFLKNRTLAAYFILAMEENRLVDIIDSQIREDCNLEQVMAAAQLARRCLKLTGKDRPSMREVSMELERIRSQSKDSKSNVHIVKNNAEEADIGVESCNKVAVSAPSGFQYNVDTTSTLDAEPLFPCQTW